MSPIPKDMTLARSVDFNEAVAWGEGRTIDTERKGMPRELYKTYVDEVTWFTDGTAVGFIHKEGTQYSEWTWESGRTDFYIFEPYR